MNRDASTVFVPDLPFLFESHINTQIMQLASKRTQTPRSALTSALRTIILYALTYIIAMIVAAYFFVQATQAVSFVLASQHGIVVRLVWLAFTCGAGMLGAVAVREWVAGDNED